MNEKEVAEIRRRFRQDKSNITHIRGCYVNDKKEIVTEFNQSIALMAQEESEKFLTILKRTLSGALGKNLIDIPFATEQVVHGAEHRLLMALRDSALKDENAVRQFFDKVIRSVDLEGNYLILLTHDTYDVFFRSADGERQEDASSEVFSYILCSICPIKQTKPALSYYIYQNEFHNSATDWLVAPPELGFLFPAFDDRSANIYNALYYSRDTAESHPGFVEGVFQCQVPMPAELQKETFQSLLGETLQKECNLEVVQAVHGQFCEMIEEQKNHKEEDPPVVSKGMFKQVLASCGVSEPSVAAFEEKYDDVFGPNTALSPRNIIDAKKFAVCTPDVTIQVNPERTELLETRIIDGVKYILIRAGEGVEVNGVNIHISE